MNIWLNKLSKKLIKIHYSKQNRKKFTFIYSLIIFGFFLLLLLSSLLFYYGIKFNSQFPDYSQWSINNLVCFIFGLIIFFVTIFTSLFFGFVIPILYKTSRNLYFHTDKYKNKVKKYTDVNLKRMNTKKIKWLYKLGYISKIEYKFSKTKK